MKDFYSVDEVSRILDIHPKTVQRFIREGKIDAVKIGRSWRVSRKALKEYAHGELSLPGEEQDYTGGDIHVSTVVEFIEQKEGEASRISNSLIALLNGKDPAWGESRYDLIYHPEDHKARFVIYGTVRFISAIMDFFKVIEERRGE